MGAEQNVVEPEKSEYEIAILDAYSNLSSKLNFAEFVGNDQWAIINLPKSARVEPKSRIRKILPGGNSDKPPGAKSGNQQKGGFFNRIRTGVGTLVRDENNLLFGERSNYEINYFEDEEDGVDTDDLHRYAQKLRELEDTDREVNPEFLVLRDGKTVYAVHEADADGKMTFSTRKPIYDRSHDQAPDNEPSEKKNFLSRIRKNPFARNKDKDSKGSNSPKSATGTPDSNGKRRTKKSNNKTTDDDMANSAPLLD
jgi:hypothetical protein